MSQKQKTKEDILANAPKFDPDKDFAEVHGHPLWRVLQNGVYYDNRGVAVEAQAAPPRVKQNIDELIKRGRDKAPDLNLDNATTIGSVPTQVAVARKENAQAAAAEDLLG